MEMKILKGEKVNEKKPKQYNFFQLGQSRPTAGIAQDWISRYRFASRGVPAYRMQAGTPVPLEGLASGGSRRVILDASRSGPGRFLTLRGWSAIQQGIGRSGPDVRLLTLFYAGFLERYGLALVRVCPDSKPRRASGSKSSGYMCSPTRTLLRESLPN